MGNSVGKYLNRVHQGDCIEMMGNLGEKALLEYKVEYKPPGVPFGSLVASGCIKVGEALYSKDKKHMAIVQADGSLEYRGTAGQAFLR